MNVFVFQSVPERYDLRKVIRVGAKDTWYATRYRNEMHPGDLVFFWMGGDQHFRGLYGWGRLESPPYLKPGWDSHGVDVKYEAKFERPVSSKTLRDDTELSEMLIFRAPQATNFLLSPSQSERLVRLIKNLGENAPSLAEV